jgi:dolichol kinase
MFSETTCIGDSAASIVDRGWGKVQWARRDRSASTGLAGYLVLQGGVATSDPSLNDA